MDKNINKVVALLKKHAPSPELSIEQCRLQLKQVYKMLSSQLKNEQLKLTNCEGHRFSLSGQSQEEAILFIHGGGFNIGSTEDHWQIINFLVTTADKPVISVDYRLAPESLYPAQLDDVVDAYQYLLKSGISANKIAIVGISAGATLTLASLLKIHSLALPLPACSVAMSPLTNFNTTGNLSDDNYENDWISQERIQSLATLYLPPGTDINTPFISPFYGDYQSTPPILLQVGDHELLLNDNLNFYQKVRAQGGKINLEVWRDMVHCWQLFSRHIPQGKKAMRSICQFINTHIP